MNPDPTPTPDDSSAVLPQPPHGCLTSVVLSVALVVVATLGGVWLITMGTMIGLAGPNAHLWAGGTYALALVVVFGSVALLLRAEQFGLWRGVALALALAGGLAGLHTLLMVFHHPFPDWLGPLQPTLTLLYALAAAILMRRHLFGKPARGVIAIGAGLALLVSAPWVVIGALGTPAQTLLGLLSGLAYGFACAVIVASIFFYDRQMPARQPFWSAVVTGIVFMAIEPGLLAGRGFLLQSVYLFLATGLAGLIGGALLALDEVRDLRRTWWGLLAFYVVLCTLPFTWSGGFEGEWMIEDMLVAWLPALIVGLVVGGLLAVLALILQRWLARQAPKRPFSAGLGLGALALTAVLFVGFGQPEIMPNTFFVVMADQVDTSQYATITDRDNRTLGVYHALVDQANKSQADLRAFLDQRGVHYTPYYLVSGLEVQGSALLRAQIAARPDVATILNSPHARPLPTSATPLSMIPPCPTLPGSIHGASTRSARRRPGRWAIPGRGLSSAARTPASTGRTRRCAASTWAKTAITTTRGSIRGITPPNRPTPAATAPTRWALSWARMALASHPARSGSPVAIWPATWAIRPIISTACSSCLRPSRWTAAPSPTATRRAARTSPTILGAARRRKAVTTTLSPSLCNISATPGR